MSKIAFTNAVVLDCTGSDPQEGMTVIVEDGIIREIERNGRVAGGDVQVVDVAGATLMPGLIDAHVHLCAAEANPAEQHRIIPPSMVAVKAVRRIEETLRQGITTVRDAGGADFGFREAVRQGLIDGPRILVSGNHIYQTGGHGDKRRPAELCCAVQATDVGLVGAMADGIDGVRVMVREQLRRQVDQVKLMCSGGAMSPGDALDAAQFSIGEITVAVEEAKAAHTYVMAHAYSGQAVINCARSGVRSIEHGNLIDEEAANEIVKAGAYLVPTLVTYEALWRHGKEFNIPAYQLEKVDAARETGLRAIEIAKRAGVKLGSGSDLMGSMIQYQPLELELKAQVMTPMEVILATTRTNAEILRLEKQIGTIEPGKVADIIVVRGDPLRNIALFQSKENIALIMKEGKIFKNTLH